LNNENSPYSRGEPYFSIGFGVGIWQLPLSSK
jgi:hypothetical protein